MRLASRVVAGMFFTVLLAVGTPADAAELRVFSAVGMRPVMEDLKPRFERGTGHTLVLEFAAAGVVVQRVLGGERADVVIVPWQRIESLVKNGKASMGDVTVIARSGIHMAVREGAPKPDIPHPTR
jgi:molybdate transport system substrate-binding protein